MTRLIFAPMVLALSSLPTTPQVKIDVSPSHHKKYETIYASVKNTGSKPVTFCIQVGQTSPKGGGEIESTPSPFFVQKNDNSKWSTLLIGPDVGNFQHARHWTQASLLKSHLLRGVLLALGKLGINGDRQIAVTRYCLRTFFDAYLKKSSGSPPEMLSPRYPEIQVLK